MGGPRLTPEQLEEASEVFARTDNVSEAARAVGVNESTLRAAFDRVRIARNRDLHARACEEGLQEGLGLLMDVARECHAILTRQKPVATGLEASDFGSLGRTINQAIGTVAAVDKRREERRAARLQREKLRAEATLAQKRAKEALALPQIREMLPPRALALLLALYTDDELAEATALLAGPQRAPEPPAGG